MESGKLQSLFSYQLSVISYQAAGNCLSLKHLTYKLRRARFVFGGTPLAVLLIAKLRSLEYYQNLPCRKILVEVAGHDPTRYRVAWTISSPLTFLDVKGSSVL